MGAVIDPQPAVKHWYVVTDDEDGRRYTRIMGGPTTQDVRDYVAKTYPTETVVQIF